MDKFIPINKKSKKAQKEYYAKKRGTWGDVNPMTRTMPNGKGYNRKKLKQEDRRNGSFSKQERLPFLVVRISVLSDMVYVLTNYNSSMEENLFRIYSLVNMGLKPFVMIYNKQKYVDDRGRWLPDATEKYSEQELRDFKVCQFMQRWCARVWIIKSCPNFNEYQPYKNWIKKGMPVPTNNIGTF